MSEQGEIDLINRNRKRVLRGRLLRALHRFYGRMPLAFESLHHAADRKAFTAREVQEALHFLEQSGYIALADNARDALDNDADAIFVLTAKGVNLANGDVADTAVEVFVPTT